MDYLVGCLFIFENVYLYLETTESFVSNPIYYPLKSKRPLMEATALVTYHQDPSDFEKSYKRMFCAVYSTEPLFFLSYIKHK